MPVYEYECRTCGGCRNVLAAITDPPPECHGPMKKLMPTSIRVAVDAPAGSVAESSYARHKAWMDSPAGRADIEAKEKKGWSMKRLREVD